MKNYRSNFQLWIIILFAIILSFLFNDTLTFAQSATSFFKQGQIIDTVHCQNDPSQKYALYLPVDYDKSKKWPVIYILEPGARATIPLDSLKHSAEKYGYILASSYNSHNGPWDKTFEANISMSEDVESRFSINPDRRYTCGFSGGSRGAMAMAVRYGNIAGIIGCGGGFPNLSDFVPTSKSSFVYYGLVGNKDLNYLEMLDMKVFFKKIGLVSHIQTFNAGHSWPRQELLNDAIEWMELQAMKKGNKMLDTSFVKSQFENYVALGEQYYNEGKVMETSRIYHDLIDEFSDYFEISEFDKKCKKIVQTKEYLKAETEWADIRSDEINLRNLYYNSINLIWEFENLADSSIIWWRNEMNYLRKLENNRNENKSLMASRLISMLGIAFIEGGSEAINIKQYNIAASLFELWIMLEPESKYAYFNLARVLALNGQTKKTLKALEKAIEFGFKNMDLLKKDSAFTFLREEKRFKALEGKMN